MFCYSHILSLPILAERLLSEFKELLLGQLLFDELEAGFNDKFKGASFASEVPLNDGTLTPEGLPFVAGNFITSTLSLLVERSWGSCPCIKIMQLWELLKFVIVWQLTANLAHLFPLSISMPVLECVGITLTEGGSKDIVFLRPRLVVPGIFGPTIDEVYLMISVSGGSLTPPRIELGSL